VSLESEDINLQLAGLAGPNAFFVRNTDWKRWFKTNIDQRGAPEYFGLSSDHEGDAAGIAYYLAGVLLPREREISASFASL